MRAELRYNPLSHFLNNTPNTKHLSTLLKTHYTHTRTRTRTHTHTHSPVEVDGQLQAVATREFIPDGRYKQKPLFPICVRVV